MIMNPPAHRFPTYGYIGLECQDCGHQSEMTNNANARQYVGRGKSTVRDCWTCKKATRHTVSR